MAKVSEKVQEAIFAQLLSIPANSECADCRTSSPTWVSLDFGVFLCMRCSGVHRQIGPHITRVRSVRLDGWTKDNIEIMATVGNQIANDYYEHGLSGYSRKPGTGSSPEECRRFVDDKYIHKKFVIQGFPEPVKDFVACRSKNTKPDFSYSNQSPSTQVQHKQPEVQQKPAEVHVRTHSENPHASAHTSFRKKSMSLDKYTPNPVQNTHQNFQQHDLLSADEDLLGGGAPQNSTAHPHPFANSASPPAKIDFKRFKKATNTQQQETPSTTQWNPDVIGGNQGQHQQQQQQQFQTQGQNQGQAPNMFNNLYNPQQQQAPPEPKIDLKQLYNQGGHQNHFMQGQQRQGWGGHGMNQQGFQGGFNGGFQGNMGMPQNNTQYNNQGYGMQPGYNQPMGGYQQQPQGPMGYGGNMGGNVQMGYNQGFGQGQPGYNQHQGNGFVQVQNGNKFF